MPAAMHHTPEGWYHQWREHGKKYYFDPADPESENEARDKAGLQGHAANAYRYRGK
jgi:hypothetical protein